MESTKQQGELKMEAVQQLYQAQSQTVHKLETQIKRLGDFILSLDCGFPTINDEYPTGMGATEAAEEYIRRLGAAVSASPQPRPWFPIETAPKDGRHIQAANFSGKDFGRDIGFGSGQSYQCVVHWWQWCDGTHQEEWGWYPSTGAGEADALTTLTHWKPLEEFFAAAPAQEPQGCPNCAEWEKAAEWAAKQPEVPAVDWKARYEALEAEVAGMEMEERMARIDEAAQEQPVENSPQKYFCSNCVQYLTKIEAMDTHDQSHDIVRVYHHPSPQKGKP